MLVFSPGNRAAGIQHDSWFEGQVQNIDKRQHAYLEHVGNLRLQRTFWSFCAQFLFTVASNDILSCHSNVFLETKSGWLKQDGILSTHSITLKNRLNRTFITCCPLVSFMIIISSFIWKMKEFVH